MASDEEERREFMKTVVSLDEDSFRAAVDGINQRMCHHKYRLLVTVPELKKGEGKVYSFVCRLCGHTRLIRVKWFWTVNKKNHPCGEFNTCYIECEGWCK